MPVDVDSDRSDGPIFHLVVEFAEPQQLIELTAALGDLEPAVGDLLEAVAGGEVIGTLARQENVRSLLEQEPREADRGACGAKPRHGSGAAVAAIHDRGIELDAAGRVENAPAAGIEAR